MGGIVMTTPTNDEPATEEDTLKAIIAMEPDSNMLSGNPGSYAGTIFRMKELARHRLAALAAAPAADWETSRGQVNLLALHHAERLLGADNAVEKIMAQSDEQLIADAMKSMSAESVKTAIRGWLDADDATHWGAFETALDAAINGTSERALIVALSSAPDLLAALEWLHLGKGKPVDIAAILARPRAAVGERNNALRQAAQEVYRVCAEARHVTLGEKARDAILALQSSSAKE